MINNTYNPPNYISQTTIINPPIYSNINNNYANTIYYQEQPQIYYPNSSSEVISHNVPYTMVPNNNQIYFNPTQKIVANNNYNSNYVISKPIYNRNDNSNNFQNNNTYLYYNGRLYQTQNNINTYNLSNNNNTFINPKHPTTFNNTFNFGGYNTQKTIITTKNMIPLTHMNIAHKNVLLQNNRFPFNNNNTIKQSNPLLNRTNININQIHSNKNIDINEFFKTEHNTNISDRNLQVNKNKIETELQKKNQEIINKKAEYLKKQNILNDIKAKTEIIINKNKPLIPLEQINTNKNPNTSDKNNNIMKKQMSDLDKNRINEQNKKNLDVQGKEKIDDKNKNKNIEQNKNQINNQNKNQNIDNNKNIPKDNNNDKNKKKEVVEVTDELSKIKVPKKEILKRPLTQKDFNDIFLTGVGIMNLGNTCFINSTLQVLIHCKIFIIQFLRKFDYINKESTPISYQFLLICISMLDSSKEKKYYIDISDFKEIFGKKHKIFNDYSQNDSQEFCRIFLEDISSELNEAKNKNIYKTLTNSIGKNKIFRDKEFDKNFKEREISIITNLFYSQIITSFKCNCGSEIYSFQKLLDFPLLLPSNVEKIELNELLNIYFKSEIVQFETECENCKKKEKHNKTTRISRPPEILIISLQRINANQKKNECLVNFPKILNLYEYIDHECGFDKEPEYILFSIINHKGSMDFGHYYSYYQPLNSSNWYEYNDSLVTHVKSGLSNFPYAYVLFYIKKKYLTLNNF